MEKENKVKDETVKGKKFYQNKKVQITAAITVVVAVAATAAYFIFGGEASDSE